MSSSKVGLREMLSLLARAFYDQVTQRRVGWDFEQLREAVHGAEVGVIGDNISLEGVVCGGVAGA